MTSYTVGKTRYIMTYTETRSEKNKQTKEIKIFKVNLRESLSVDCFVFFWLLFICFVFYISCDVD